MKVRVAWLDRVKDEKIPYYEKLNKNSTFYKHLMSNLYTDKVEQTGKEATRNEQTLLHEVAETIPKVN